MIVKDEVGRLEFCLRSVKGLVEEVVLVDTGSTDGTPELATSLGARVFPIPWEGGFASMRNQALQRAACPWILVLDADEYLESASADAIMELLHNPMADGYQLVARNLSAPGDAVDWYDTPVLRLFRNRPEYRFEGRLHEQVSPSISCSGGRIVATTITFIHTGYQQAKAQGSSRVARNLALLESMIAEDDRDPYVWYQLGITLKAAGRSPGQAWKQALEHGIEGCGSAVLADLHRRMAQDALERGATAAALHYAGQSLQRVPDDPTALQVAGVAHLERGELVEAAALLRRLCALPQVRPELRALSQRMLKLTGA